MASPRGGGCGHAKCNNSDYGTGDTSSDEISSQGAYALSPSTSVAHDETLLKSAELSTAFEDCSISQGETNHRSRMVNQTVVSQGQLDDTSQDVSLNSHPATIRTDAPTSFAVNSTESEEAEIQMNILPSMTPQNRNNTPAIAENQLSFRELPNSVSIPQAMPEKDRREYSLLLTSGTSSAAAISVDDNTCANNLSVNSMHRTTEMTAQPVAGARAQAPADQHVLSHSSSVISLRSEIPHNCPVRKLPSSILVDVISLELQDTRYPGSWMDLVEKYGWNYDKSIKFARKHADEKIFLALLKVDPFQTYALDQLRSDLRSLPRMDLLEELDEAIEKHNNEATNSASQH